MSRTHSHTQIKHHIAMNCLFCKSSLVRIGFETLLRRFRVGSLVGRSKFPYAPHKTHPHTALSRPLLCRISSARLHCVEAIHSPRSARNAGHRFTKNSYQPFFPRSHTKIPIGLMPSGFFSYSLVTCIKRGTRHDAK